VRRKPAQTDKVGQFLLRCVLVEHALDHVYPSRSELPYVQCSLWCSQVASATDPHEFRRTVRMAHTLLRTLGEAQARVPQFLLPVTVLQIYFTYKDGLIPLHEALSGPLVR
jgi:hypothetical protein